MVASSYGHTEAIKLLLTATDINVNQADVSLYLLTLSYLALGVGIWEIYLTLSLTNPRNDDLSSLTA